MDEKCNTAYSKCLTTPLPALKMKKTYEPKAIKKLPVICSLEKQCLKNIKRFDLHLYLQMDV